MRGVRGTQQVARGPATRNKFENNTGGFEILEVSIWAARGYTTTGPDYIWVVG